MPHAAGQRQQHTKALVCSTQSQMAATYCNKFIRRCTRQDAAASRHPPQAQTSLETGLPCHTCHTDAHGVPTATISIQFHFLSSLLKVHRCDRSCQQASFLGLQAPQGAQQRAYVLSTTPASSCVPTRDSRPPPCGPQQSASVNGEREGARKRREAQARLRHVTREGLSESPRTHQVPV
jgi:hypothetical protein